MRLARLAAALAGCASVVSCSSGPAMPTGLVAERTDDLFSVRVHWTSRCEARCDIEVLDERGGRLFAAVALPGEQSLLATFPNSVQELARLTVRVRNSDGREDSAWASVPYQVGIWPVSLTLLTVWWSGGEARREVTCGWTHGSSHADGAVLERRIATAGDATEDLWEIMPIDRGATEYRDPDADRWVDHAVFEYRIRSLAGEIPSPPRSLSNSPAPPATPADVSLALEGDVLRLRWRNRSTIATELQVGAVGSVAATLPISAQSWEEPAPGPGFLRRGVQAVARGDGVAIAEESGFVEAILLVPDPALAPLFTESTDVMPSAELAARLPDGGWALGEGMVGFAPAEVRVPYGGGWSVWQSPPSAPWNYRSGALAAPGPLVDAAGRVHAITTVESSGARPVLHVWWEDGAWHEEGIGYGDVPRFQIWAALDAQGNVHAVWRSGAGVAMATYATNRGGSWTSEEVPAAAFASDDQVRRPFAVTPGGEAVMLFPAPDGEPGFVLHRRLADGWTAERIPDGLAISPGPVGLLAASADRIAWLSACGGAAPTVDVCLRERTEAGWGADEVLERGVPFYYDSTLAAASADGGRSAYALPVGGGRLRLHLREGASRVTYDLAAASGVGAVGFTEQRRVWVVTGLGHPVPWPVTYLEYEER